MKKKRSSDKRSTGSSRPRSLPVKAITATSARAVKGGATTAQKAAEKADQYIRA